MIMEIPFCIVLPANDHSSLGTAKQSVRLNLEVQKTDGHLLLTSKNKDSRRLLTHWITGLSFQST